MQGKVFYHTMNQKISLNRLTNYKILITPKQLSQAVKEQEGHFLGLFNSFKHIPHEKLFLVFSIVFAKFLNIYYIINFDIIKNILNIF